MKKLVDYVVNNKKTAFLKVILTLLFIPVVLISLVAAPNIIIEGMVNPDVSFGYVLPFGILMGLMLLPVAYAIVQTWILLTYIEQSIFYSEQSGKRFNIITKCAIVATILFTGMIPSVFYFAQMDDAPGLALLGLIFVGASVAVAVFSSLVKDVVLERSE